jgi:hypothetical protein
MNHATNHRHPRFGQLALAVALTLGTGSAFAGQLGSIDVVTRPDSRVLPVYAKDGRGYVIGTPGQEYGIRVCNTTGERVLAVMSVDGVNVVSGETASPAQSGYVLSAHECADINGWRTSSASTAAFYFTTLADAYSTRTGRPDNVGVIGVAFFRERVQRMTWKDSPAKIAAAPESRPRQDAGESDALGENKSNSAPAARGEMAAEMAAPAPLAKIGTGYGRPEQSYVQTTRFVRESPTPNETLAINYDRRDNLIAMGVLPGPSIARSVNPFPAWNPRYVPEPPTR